MKLRLIYDDVAREAKSLRENKGHQPTVAIDLDGTLTVDGGFKGPHTIAKPRQGAREALERFRDWGFRIIIFTVRGNTERIKDWLEEHDIPYDHINTNPDQPDDSSGKVISDIYIDDRAIDGRLPWSELEKMVKERLKKLNEA